MRSAVGGTFDATIVQVKGGSIIPIATDGERDLGSADWDMRIQERISEEASKLGMTLDGDLDPASRQALIYRGENLKHMCGDN